MRLAAPSACTTGCASICPTVVPKQAMAAPASLPTWGALTDPNLARDSYFAKAFAEMREMRPGAEYPWPGSRRAQGRYRFPEVRTSWQNTWAPKPTSEMSELRGPLVKYLSSEAY